MPDSGIGMIPEWFGHPERQSFLQPRILDRLSADSCWGCRRSRRFWQGPEACQSIVGLCVDTGDLPG